jgi:HEAT repeat protein
MGFKKLSKLSETRSFKSFKEAEKALENDSCTIEDKLEAIEYLIVHKEFYYVLQVLTKLFSEDSLNTHPIIDVAFAKLKNKPKRKEDFEELFKILKSNNAYLRNAAISFLQNYDKEAEPFIKELLQDKDKDIRIFAINILGDAKLENSLELLRVCIKNEEEINVLMTAVDYIREIGTEEDISLLEKLKERFSNEPYVEFSVNLAIEKIKDSQ